jgi:hypothetical protein
MVLAVFILDFLYRQNSIFDGDPTVKQKQVTEPQTVKEDSPKKSSIESQPHITQIRFTNESRLKAQSSKRSADSIISTDYADYTD